MAKNTVIELKEDELTHFIMSKEGSVRGKLLDELDKQLIGRCMKLYDNNQTRVAEVLGMNRGTLRTRLKNLRMPLGKA